MPSYTEDEKYHIAKNHLIPKQMNANSLTKTMFKLGKDEILYLIGSIREKQESDN